MDALNSYFRGITRSQNADLRYLRVRKSAQLNKLLVDDGASIKGDVNVSDGTLSILRNLIVSKDLTGSQGKTVGNETDKDMYVDTNYELEADYAPMNVAVTNDVSQCCRWDDWDNNC